MMEPIVVSPPLRGKWNALNCPGDQIPSHGTNEWGMTYAYDFYRLEADENGSVSWHNQPRWKYWLGLVRLGHSYSWGEPIHAPFDGVVREVVTSVKERSRLHYIRDVGLALFNGIFFSYQKGKVHALTGNYLIIEGEKCCALIAHAQYGSIKHEVGNLVCRGEVVARLGHSGNSTAPHLHFQLMDRVDIRNAKGYPCAFDKYSIYQNQTWEPVEHGVPSSTYPIRFS
ncbi:M23 family metallopeptidase [Photobacterium minamisatsumaniensis]|uniref:M23 family metallopeptidase n=1 Tax=Photobacterium minamisatsumaniensis TaxID=2910233 RepID=UPI003D0E0867